mmetsp:Transcript_18911/g.58270  ORF Transcript_18911/g.58270 Transcript_18911/m.58270 type:complete len:443 (-) Transcript_18911:1492-2820(-)
MRRHDVLDRHERLGRVGVVRRQDRQPREHRPQPVLFADVVAAGAERLLAAHEGRVVGASEQSFGVHQIAEELPARRRLEERQVQFLRHQVDGAGRRHRPRHCLEAALLLEERDDVRVRRQHRQRVRRRDEELGAEDHVPVAVAVRGRAEGRHCLGSLDRATGLVDAHGLDEVDRVREVGVCVVSAEVVEGHGVQEAVRRQAERVHEERARVGARDAVHRVEDEGKVGSGEQRRLEDVEVENCFEKIQVRRDGVDDGHADDAGLVGGLDDHVLHRRRVHGREVLAALDGRDGRRVRVDQIRQLFGRRAAVLAVVLDAKVLLGAARVVRGRQQEGAEALLPGRAALADDGGDGRSGRDAVLGEPDAAHAVRGGDLHDDLGGDVVVVAPVAADEERHVLQICAGRFQGRERRLDEVVQVEAVREDFRFFPQTRRSGLLARDRRRL